MQRYTSSGFTLLELMVAISIVAILLGIGVPSFSDAMRRNRVANVTNDLAGALALARSESVKRGMSVTVCGSTPPPQTACAGSTDWKDGLVVFSDDTGVVGVIDGTDQIIQKFAGAVEDNIGLTADRNFLTYRPSGSALLPAGVSAVIDVVPSSACNGEDARRITIFGAGRSEVKKVAC